MLSKLREQTKKIRENSQVRRRVQACLTEIAGSYDFERFTLEDFGHWIAKQRGRPLEFVSREMPARVSGAWMTLGEKDFVFYDQNALSPLQAQIQLHELSHILAGHTTLDLGTAEGRAFFILLSTQVTAEVPAHSSGRMRSVYSNQEEMEADEIAALIQREAESHAKLHELTKAIPGGFAEFFSDFLASIEMDT